MINIKGKIVDNYGVRTHVGIGAIRYINGSDLYAAIEQYFTENPLESTANIITINSDNNINAQDMVSLKRGLYYVENEIEYYVSVLTNGTSTKVPLMYGGLLFVHDDYHHYLEFGEKIDAPYVFDGHVYSNGIAKVKMTADIYSELEKKLDADRALSNIEIQDILKW